MKLSLLRLLEDDLFEYEKDLSPEERLLVAVFDSALVDLPPNGYPGVSQHDRRSARLYFRRTDTSHLFSLGYFCAHFEIDVNDILADLPRIVEYAKQRRKAIRRRLWKTGPTKKSFL